MTSAPGSWLPPRCNPDEAAPPRSETTSPNARAGPCSGEALQNARHENKDFYATLLSSWPLNENPAELPL
jgi:hypothetical protein